MTTRIRSLSSAPCTHVRQTVTRGVGRAAMVFGLSVALSIPAEGQWRVGGFVGGEHDSSWDEFLVLGADVRREFGARGLEFNPRFTYFLRDGTTRYQADLNLIKPLILARPGRIEPFVGLGVALERISDSNSAQSSTNVGFNYIVGGSLRTAGRWQPFGQFEYSVLNDTGNNAVVSLGLHYRFGGSRTTPVPAPRPTPTRR
jgi:hypothetical protein